MRELGIELVMCLKALAIVIYKELRDGIKSLLG